MNQKQAIDAMRKMYEHEPMLTDEERAKHIELATDQILGKLVPQVRERVNVGILERTDNWKGRNAR